MMPGHQGHHNNHSGLREKTTRNRGTACLALISVALFILSSLLVIHPLQANDADPEKSTVYNFHRVTDHLYRGGVPIRNDLFKLKRDFDIKTVIDFRMVRDSQNKEIWKTDYLEMNYIQIPWNSSPDVADQYDYHEIADQFLNHIEENSELPIYVHCVEGKRRTGAMIAVYRMAKEGWTADQAIREAEKYGLDKRSHPNLVAFLYEYEKKLGKMNSQVDPED